MDAASSAVTSENRALHEIVAESSTSGIVVCDESGSLLYANSQTGTIFGYHPSELTGLPLDTLLPSERPNGPSDGRRTWANPDLDRGARGRRLGRRKDGSEIKVEVEWSSAREGGRRLFVASLVDAGATRLPERTAQAILFERVVADLAARFVSLAPTEVDDAIIDSQRQIVEALEIDRCLLWQFVGDEDELIYTHAWVRPGFEPVPPTAPAKELFPWFLDKIRANEVVWFDSVDEIPAAFDRDNARPHTKSNAIIPM